MTDTLFNTFTFSIDDRELKVQNLQPMCGYLWNLKTIWQLVFYLRHHHKKLF